MAYRDKDGSASNDPVVIDIDKGDIDANNIREDSFWYWDGNDGKEIKAMVLDTTEPNPVGYVFLNPDLVNSVKAQIEAFYNSIPAFDPTTLQAQADAILVMPAEETFPAY